MKKAGLIAAGVLALASGTGWAQVGPTPGGGVTVESPFSVANVDPAQPFGTVDVTMAGADAESMRTWAASLAADLKIEISQRCDVISSYSSSFPPDAVGFCSTWSTVQASEPLPAVPGSGIGAPPAAVPGAL